VVRFYVVTFASDPAIHNSSLSVEIKEFLKIGPHYCAKGSSFVLFETPVQCSEPLLLLVQLAASLKLIVPE